MLTAHELEATCCTPAFLPFILRIYKLLLPTPTQELPKLSTRYSYISTIYLTHHLQLAQVCSVPPSWKAVAQQPLAILPLLHPSCRWHPERDW